MVEHGVVGAGVPVLETRGGHAGQAVHATVVRPVSCWSVLDQRNSKHEDGLPVGIRHGAGLRYGGIHGVEAGVER